MDQTIIATSSRLEVIGYDGLTPLINFLFGSDGLIAGVSITGWFGFFSSLWSVFVVLSYLVSFILLVLYIYASIQGGILAEEEEDHIKAGEEAYAASFSANSPKTDRFAELKVHLESENPNDWKQAIIEADIILEKALKDKGFAGPTLGEMLKSASPSSMNTLQDAWDAHLVRNKIAHGGADFVLTQKIARETLVQYDRVFAELGVK